MSTIPKQTLIIDNDTDIGLTSDLINGTYKSSSLTDLSNNLYTKITDLSSNVYSQLSNKQATLTSSTSLLGNGSNISSLNYNNLINKPTNFQSDWNSTIINKPDISVYALNTSLSTLNASNITSGTLPISRGGIGTVTLTANQILIGNAATSILQSANLTWNNTSNTLSASNFGGSGAGLTNLNVSNAASGTLPISRGGIGTVTLTANQILIGNAATSILQSANLTWNNTSNTLSATNFIGSGSGITNLDYNYITINKPTNFQSDWNSTIINKPDLSSYAIKSNVDTSLNAITTTLGTKQNTLTFTTPLKKDVSNNITIDLSNCALKTNVDISLSLINTNIATKQNYFTCITPLIKNDVSNNITIDLSAYPLKTYVDGSLNTINSSLATKQNTITTITPLKKDVSNNITIDLSAYPLKTYVDGSLNTINTALGTKQNNLTFSNPFLNTSNTISLKYNAAQFNIDSSGNLNIISGGGTQWTTSGTKISYNGIVNINAGSPYATSNYTLNKGSLVIGDTLLNYGGGTSWNGGNAAGLMLECASNTEIAVHDSGHRLASLIYFEGDANNKITIGRDMGWGTISNLILNGTTTFNNSSTNFWYNSPGTYFTNNGFSSYFSLNSNVITNGGGVAVEPFIRVYNRMWKNGANTAMDIKTFGNSNSGVNSDVLIRIDSGGDPTPGANAGTITFNINGSDRHLITGSSFGINTITPGSYALNVNGVTYFQNNVGIGVNPNCRLYISTNAGNNVNSFAIRVSSSGGTDGSGYATLIGLGAESGGWSKCAIGHTRTGGYDVGDIVFLNRNTIDNADCTMSDEKMRIVRNGRVGIQNNNPQSMLHLGNCTVANSAPVIVFGKNVNGTGYRNAFMGYTDSFFFVIGDYGNTNTGSNALTQQLAIIYSAPALSILVGSNGYVTMQYGYGGASDERIKTNIKTIENALDKTLLLRGVEYNDIRIEPEKKKIGLIAQEVELIIPEVVRTDEQTSLKSIEYQNLVGLLIEAIKELNNKVLNLENILKNNNLY